MKIDKITGSVPNCIACQIAYDNSDICKIYKYLFIPVI